MDLDFLNNFYFSKNRKGIYGKLSDFFSSNFSLFDTEKGLKQLKT